MARVIACMDLDYFYAQAEEVRNPAIKGRPVVVCMYSGRTNTSGAVASCNYEARRLGVKAGMPIYRAMDMLRGLDAVFLPVDKEYYQALSRRVMDTLASFSSLIEVASIDEAYLDITNETGGDLDQALRYMIELKAAVKRETGLACSVGIGQNKVVAKMAADASKPDGLLLVRPDTLAEFLSQRPVDDLPYVGRKMADRLASMGIHTIGELARMDPQILKEKFGEKVGTYLYLASRGEYDEPVKPSEGRDEISRIITLKRDTRSVADLMRELEGPLGWLCERLRSEGLIHRGVGVIAITTDMQLITRSRTLSHPNKEAETIRRNAQQLFEKLLEENPRMELRRIGLKLFGLEPIGGQRLITEYG